MTSTAIYRLRARLANLRLPKTSWKIGGIILVLSFLVLLALWKLPIWQVANTPANAFDRENEARKTLAQIIGGIALLSGLYISLKTLGLSREGHLTDRFTRAIEQLGKTDGVTPNLEIRLGAIYALERIARDSPRDHWTIMEILTAYVRQNAPLDPDRSLADGEKPRIDIQAILSVLGRREIAPDRERPNDIRVYLKLMPSRLCGASFIKARFKGVDMESVVLREAIFRDADLREACFKEADLQDVDFIDADLRGTYFYLARLDRADLKRADLSEAKDLTIEQVHSARNWELAHYSPELRAKLGLPAYHPTAKLPHSERS